MTTKLLTVLDFSAAAVAPFVFFSFWDAFSLMNINIFKVAIFSQDMERNNESFVALSQTLTYNVRPRVDTKLNVPS